MISSTRDRVEIADRFCRTRAPIPLINAVPELPEDCRVALLVGYAPGAPGVVYELTNKTTSTPEAVSAIEGHFPAAALAQLEFKSDWLEGDSGRLVSVRMPRHCQPLTDNHVPIGLLAPAGVTSQAPTRRK